MLSFCSRIKLSNVDFPTLGRPTNATKPHSIWVITHVRVSPTLQLPLFAPLFTTRCRANLPVASGFAATHYFKHLIVIVPEIAVTS